MSRSGLPDPSDQKKPNEVEKKPNIFNNVKRIILTYTSVSQTVRREYTPPFLEIGTISDCSRQIPQFPHYYCRGDLQKKKRSSPISPPVIPLDVSWATFDWAVCRDKSSRNLALKKPIWQPWSRCGPILKSRLKLRVLTFFLEISIVSGWIEGRALGML